MIFYVLYCVIGCIGGIIFSWYDYYYESEKDLISLGVSFLFGLIFWPFFLFVGGIAVILMGVGQGLRWLFEKCQRSE